MINEADKKVLVTAFTNRLQSGEFLFSIYKNDLKTITDMLYKTMKYMNAKDAMVARGGKLKKRERQDDPSPDKGRKATRTSNRRDDMRLRHPPRRTVNFSPLNTPLDQVLMQIRDNVALTWLNKLKDDPNKRPKKKVLSLPSRPWT